MSTMRLKADILLPGTARGRILKVDALSLWGGIDPHTGRLIDPSIAHCGESVAGTVLAIIEPRGSSSSSAVMLELLHCGRAPAAVILARIDAILGLGIVVARELGWPTIPLLLLSAQALRSIPDASVVEIAEDGDLNVLG